MNMIRDRVKISDVLFFQEGPGVRNTQYTTSGVKLLNVANLVDGYIDLSTSDRYISTDEAYGKYSHFLCDDGDFVVASSGIKVEYIDKKMGFVDSTMLPLCMNTSTIRFKVLDSKKLNIRYFMYYLKSQDFKTQLSVYITGSAQLNYGPSHLKKMTMPIVEMHKQDKIVEILDKVNQVIENRKQQLQQFDELVKARFVELFGDPVTNEKMWPRLTLGDICEIGSSKRVFEKDYVSKGIPFFRTKEIVELSKGNKISTELYISEEHFNLLKENYGVPKKDDLLISAVGTIGVIWIVNGDFEFYFKDGNLIQIKSSNNFNSIFMKYLLGELIDNYKKEMSTGTAYSALTIVGLKKMLVYDVPLELQNQFATFVEQVDKSKFAVQKALDEAQTLFDSLMQQYFG